MAFHQSQPRTAGSVEEGEQALSARDRLLEKIAGDADLPALGSSVARVVQMASSDDEAVRDLAHFILSDVGLTQKVLRLSNTVTYRTASGGSPVTTVSKAIFLLGFDTVKTSALAMLLVEGLSGKHAKHVREELNQALCASIVGREMARRSQYKDAEEAAIAALFKNVGRVLVAAYEPGPYNEIVRLVESGSHTPSQASMAVLGCSFELLAGAVLREWNIPESIVQTLAPPSSGVLRPARTRQEWLQQTAAFSAAAARVIADMDRSDQEVAIKALLNRFGGAFGLDHERLGELFEAVAHETHALASSASLLLPSEDLLQATEAEAVGQQETKDEAESQTMGEDLGLPSELLLHHAEPASPSQVIERYPSGKPTNARDLLLTGVQDVTHMMSSGRCKTSELMMLVLETLYNSLGFRFATFCLKDAQTKKFRARIAIGENNVVRQNRFVFPADQGNDLFQLALKKDADLVISDAGALKSRDLLPDWHRALLPDARSFIVLPLIVQNRQLGIFYADRALAAPEGVPPDETALIKTLKGQVLAALNSR